MLILTLMLLTLLWFSLLIFSSSTLQALKTSANYLGSERASSTAEAGILYGIEMLKADPTWRPRGATTKMKYTDEKFRLDVYDATSAPEAIPSDTLYLRSVGQSRTGQKRTAVAVVKIGKAQGGLFDYAFFASDIDTSGGVRVDAFNPLTGKTVSGAGNLATNSTNAGAVRLNSGVIVDGNITVGVKGNVTDTTSSPGRTWGTNNVVWKNWNATTTGESTFESAQEYPTVSIPEGSKKDTSVNVNWKGDTLSPGYYDTINASGGGVATLQGGSYYLDTLNISGGASLAGSGTEPVVLYVRDKVQISNGTTSNISRLPRNLVIILADGASLNITGGSTVYAMVYGPGADVKLSGGSRLYGAVVGDTINMTGGFTMTYDVTLLDDPPKVTGLSGSSSGSSGGGGVSIVSRRRY